MALHRWLSMLLCVTFAVSGAWSRPTNATMEAPGIPTDLLGVATTLADTEHPRQMHRCASWRASTSNALVRAQFVSARLQSHHGHGHPFYCAAI